MQVRTELPIKREEQTVIALGNFDGVHLGHRKLLHSGLGEARRLEVKFSVLVFDPHPLKVLFPELGVKLITTVKERLKIFESLGVDTVYLLPFTRQLADIPPQSFVEEFLLPLGVVHTVVGFNYSFGAKGLGTPANLQHFGLKYNFGVSVLQAQTVNGRVVSSSSIRKAIAEGDIFTAREMLGRVPCLCGTVVQGEQRGRQLGYPTANIMPPDDLLIPKRGVYAVWAELEGKLVKGMMNIGMKPTFHNMFETTIEVHFFDLNRDLYGKNMTIYIHKRLRDERRFAGISELCRQLEIDANQARISLQKNISLLEYSSMK